RTEQAYNIMGFSKKDPPFPGFPVYSPERTFSPREPYVNNGRGETGSIGGVRKNHGHLRPRILPSRKVWIPEGRHRAGPGLEVAYPYQRDSLRRPAGHPAGEPRGRLRPGPRYRYPVLDPPGGPERRSLAVADLRLFARPGQLVTHCFQHALPVVVWVERGGS